MQVRRASRVANSRRRVVTSRNRRGRAVTPVRSADAGGAGVPRGQGFRHGGFPLCRPADFPAVSVNGKRQEKFVFDTGSENTIDTSRALALGLTVEKAGNQLRRRPRRGAAGGRGRPVGGGGCRLVNTIVQTTVMVSRSSDEIEERWGMNWRSEPWCRSTTGRSASRSQAAGFR